MSETAGKSETAEIGIYQALAEMQYELNIEKTRKNTHYNYSYRNAEDIIAGIKPALKKHKMTLILGQDMKESGGLVFLQVIVTLKRGGAEIVNNYFCPVQAPNKEGQSMSQAFGATISYANKYALASLFLLDDGLDSDSMNGGQQKVQQQHVIDGNPYKKNQQGYGYPT